jgi:DNA (cytosine-5)-methyltransferase 1
VNTKNNSVHANEIETMGNLDKPEWVESRRRVYSQEGISPTLHGIGCGGNTEAKIVVMGMLDIQGKEQIRRVYSKDHLAPTLSTMQGGSESQR